MRFFVAALVLGSVGVGACRDSSAPGSSRGPLGQVPEGAQAVTIETILREPYSGIREARRVVVRDADTWARFWAEATAHIQPAPAAPAIDFATSMVIAATLGTRASGGYAIVIDEVSFNAEGIFATVREIAPGAGCFTTQAVTAPVTAVSLDRIEGTVSFLERSETRPCP